MKKYTEVRCPGERAHKVKGVDYEICGNIIGGLLTNISNKAIFHCHMCGFWEAEINDDREITMTKIDTSNGKRIDFDKKTRRVKNG